MSIEIRPSVPEDIPEIAKVLSQAALYKAKHGDYMWGTKPFTIEEVEAKLQAGGLYTVIVGGAISATVTLLDNNERVWDDNGENNEAFYIHLFATSDEMRGRNVGGQVLDWAEEQAREKGRKAIRLHCSYTNQKLCAYYKSHGFIELTRKDIARNITARDFRDPIFKASLLERKVN